MEHDCEKCSINFIILTDVTLCISKIVSLYFADIPIIVIHFRHHITKNDNVDVNS